MRSSIYTWFLFKGKLSETHFSLFAQHLHVIFSIWINIFSNKLLGAPWIFISNEWNANNAWARAIALYLKNQFESDCGSSDENMIIIQISNLLEDTIHDSALRRFRISAIT